MNSAQFGLVSSIFTLGGLLGALAAGPVTARYGRYKAMLLTTIPFIIGPALELSAANLALLTAGRLISGLGAGAAVVTVPLYISEIAPPHEKGFFGAFTQVMINAGIFIAQLLGYFLSKGQLWRIILAVGGVIGIVQAIGLLLAGQESPKWLAENKQGKKAKQILRKIRGHSANVEEEITGWGLQSTEDMDEEEQSLLQNADEDPGASSSSRHASAQPRIKDAAQDIKQEVIGVLGVLMHPDTRPAVFAVIGVMVFQQLLGINSIVMYGVSLLSDLLKANSALLNVAVSALNIFITILAAPLPDKFGRKACLLVSMTGMGISSIMLGIGIMNGIKVLSAVAVLTFVGSFGVGLGPIPFILSSELVDSKAVGATQSWALAANWMATFLVAQFFPIVNEKLGAGKIYFLFAGLAALSIAFVAWTVPETKDKADADEVWGRKSSSQSVD